MFQSTLPRGERHVPIVDVSGMSSVSIHAPAGGATLNLFFITPIISRFNPRSRGGSDRVLTLAHTYILSFNPRSRGGSDVYQCLGSGFLRKFQSTLPRGERPKSSSIQLGSICFNPRSRGGSDLSELKEEYFVIKFQSTLPRGERRIVSQLFWPIDVSIHAPAGGATTGSLEIAEQNLCFNPRSRGGSDCVLLFYGIL